MSVDLPFKHSVVDGLVVPAFMTQKRLDELRDFQLRPEDVFIVTYMKSGTTWLQQIAKLIRNEGKEDGKTILDATPWPEALNTEFLYGYWMDLDQLPSPRVFKSHFPYSMMVGGLPHTTQAKYIYVARNPKDVAVSLYYHLRGFCQWDYSGEWGDFFGLFMKGHVPFGLWFDHVLGWWKYREEKNVLFLKFEDIKKDLPGAVRTVAEFMGQSLKPELVDRIVDQSTFESMKANPTANFSWESERQFPDATPFMRKGTIGDWKNHFTAEQNAEIDAVYAERMKGSGLEFDYVA